VSDPSYSPSFDEAGPFFPPDGEDTNARTSPSVAPDPNVEPSLVAEDDDLIIEDDDGTFLTSDPAEDNWDDVAGVNDGLIGADGFTVEDDEDELDDLDDDELEDILDYTDDDELDDDGELDDEDEDELDDLDDVDGLDDENEGPHKPGNQGLSDTQPL
jgi:hypothetical protein